MLGSIAGFILEHWEWIAGGGGLVGSVAAAFIPGVGPALALFRANWKWLVPTVIAVGLGIYAGTQRINYVECKSDRAESIAKAEKAAREFLAADYAHSQKLVADYAGEIAELQGKYEDAQIRLAKTPSVAACGNTPAARAFDDGVSKLEREAGDSPPPGAGRAHPPMSAPTRSPGNLRR